MIELLPVNDRKQLILTFSILIPLKHGFFNCGFSNYRLKKLCELFETTWKILGSKEKDEEAERLFEEISGEKLTTFLRNCFHKINEDNVKYEQAKEQFEIRIRELETKLGEFRKSRDEEQTTNGYNISFKNSLIKKEENLILGFGLIPLI